MWRRFCGLSKLRTDLRSLLTAGLVIVELLILPVKSCLLAAPFLAEMLSTSSSNTNLSENLLDSETRLRVQGRCEFVRAMPNPNGEIWSLAQPLSETMPVRSVRQRETKRRVKGPKKVRIMKLQGCGVFAKSIRGFGTLVVASAVLLLVQNASAQLIESWENTLDGWTVQQAAYSSAFSTKLGVTDGTYSLALTVTAGPTYGQMLLGPSLMSNTLLLGNAASLSLDIYTPPASFGFFLQFDVDVDNADIGYQSIDGYSYPATVIGSQYTLTIPIPAFIQTGLAASANPTTIVIQIGGGYTDGNETMYLDNLRVTAIPEPSTIALLGFGLIGLVCVARRRVS
jgi:PEP-CTERM motif